MNRKLSQRGKILLKAIKPFITAFGWISFVGAVIWAIVHDFSFLGGILFVGGVQAGIYLVTFGVLLGTILFLEKKWEKERNERGTY